jgi:hypothetical protein
LCPSASRPTPSMIALGRGFPFFDLAIKQS